MKRRSWPTVTLVAASVLTVMPYATLQPSLPAIADHFADLPRNEYLVSLILVVPALGITLAAPFMGWLADRCGRWRALSGSVALFILSGGSGYWAPNLPLLLLGRFVLGWAIAGITTSTTALLGALPESAQRQIWLGRQSACINAAGLIYLLVGGWLAAAHWRVSFLLFLWPALLMPFIAVCLQDQPRGPTRTSTPATGALLPFLQGPFMPPTIFVWAMGFALMAVLYTAMTALPFWMRNMDYGDPRLISTVVVAGVIPSAATSWNFRRLRTRLKAPPAFALAFLAFAAGLFAIAASRSLWHVMAGMVLFGAGMGIPVPNGAAWLNALAPDALRGRLVGIFTTCVFVGQFLSPTFMAALNAVTGDLTASYALLGSICLVLACLILASHRLLSSWTGAG